METGAVVSDLTDWFFYKEAYMPHSKKTVNSPTDRQEARRRRELMKKILGQMGKARGNAKVKKKGTGRSVRE